MKRTPLKRSSTGLKKSQLKRKKKTPEQVAEQKEQSEKMWQLFNEHWELKTVMICAGYGYVGGISKTGFCESCGTAIWGENKSLYHHHCWPKAQYPEYAYNINNLLLVCGECHAKIESAMVSEETRKKIEEIKKNVVHS